MFIPIFITYSRLKSKIQNKVCVYKVSYCDMDNINYPANEGMFLSS